MPKKSSDALLFANITSVLRRIDSITVKKVWVGVYIYIHIYTHVYVYLYV